MIGGGLPVGAYGGRKDIMEMVAPSGPMYQAGTLSGNPLAMSAGIKVTISPIASPNYIITSSIASPNYITTSSIVILGVLLLVPTVIVLY